MSYFFVSFILFITLNACGLSLVYNVTINITLICVEICICLMSTLDTMAPRDRVLSLKDNIPGVYFRCLSVSGSSILIQYHYGNINNNMK